VVTRRDDRRGYLPMNAVLLFFVVLTWWTRGWRLGLAVVAVGVAMNLLFRVSDRYRAREGSRGGPTP
jgi:hypothetical protein